jgi:hypothetical protein
MVSSAGIVRRLYACYSCCLFVCSFVDLCAHHFCICDVVRKRIDAAGPSIAKQLLTLQKMELSAATHLKLKEEAVDLRRLVVFEPTHDWRHATLQFCSNEIVERIVAKVEESKFDDILRWLQTSETVPAVHVLAGMNKYIQMIL